MSLIQLRSIIEVHRQRSISKAAAMLGLTQPAVSQHIASLEAQIERQLFIRQPRGVQPTAVADDLVRRVSEGLDLAESTLAEMRARSTRLAGRLHLCGPSDILSDLVGPRLHVLIRQNLSLSFHPAHGERVNELLLEGGADFGFGVGPVHDPRIASATVGAEELVLAAPPELAAQIRAAGDLARGIADQPFVAYENARMLNRQWLEHNGLDIGRAEQVVLAPDLRCLRNLLVHGFGWAVLPRFVVRKQLAEGSLEEITGPRGNPVTPYQMLWLKSALRNPRTAHARTLILQQFIHDHTG